VKEQSGPFVLACIRRGKSPSTFIYTTRSLSYSACCAEDVMILLHRLGREEKHMIREGEERFNVKKLPLISLARKDLGLISNPISTTGG